MKRRGKSSPAYWRQYGCVNPTRSNTRQQSICDLQLSGGGWSYKATYSRDRLSSNTEPGLWFAHFYKKNKQSVYTDCCFYFIWIFPLLMWYTLYKYKFGMDFTMKWEFAFLYLLQDMHTPVLDKIMLFFTRMGNFCLPWLAISVILLCFKKTRPCGVAILLSLLMKELTGNLALKNLVARERPCWIDTAVPLLIKSPSSYSFPSGHTFDGFAASVSIFLYNRKAGVAAIIVAVIIAFSRMYLFVHFPTDVLASVILGTIVAVFAHKIVEAYYPDNIYKIHR